MRGRPLRVLLVEDSENDALLLLRELRRGGYEPECERVSTPEEMELALEEARKRGKPWEVVLSDYYMPRFRGPDALDLLRGLGYDTPFVVVSGKIGEDAAVAMMRAGAQDYVAKENLARLCPAIERELREAEGRRERERAEEALRDSEGRYRVVAETASDAIILIDEDSRILVINGAAEKIFGYARAEMLGQRLTMLMPERLRGAHEASLRHYVETGRRHLDWGSIQLLGLHKSGREIPIEVSFGEFVRDGKRFFTGFVRDMTERLETEKRLREAEIRYRTFIGQSTEGIWRFELEEPLPADLPEGEQIERFYRHGYLAECNDAMARMYGYERAEEIVGARLADLLPSSIPENVEYLEAFVRSGYRMVDAESFEVDREGNARYFLNNLTGIVEDGFLVRAWGTQREVTERKRFEEELRESEERFRATFEQAAVGVAHVSLEGRWLRVNQKLSEIVGYSGEELLRMTFQDITHGDDLETDLEQVRRLLAGEIDTYSMEKRYIRKDGSIVWINLTASLVRDIEGPPKYFIAVIEDITERKRAEDERSRLAAIVESSDDAILGKTLEGIITSWNRAAERLYGYSVEEAVGQPISILVPPDRPEEVPEILRKVRQGQKVERLETVRVTKNGERLDVSLTVSPIRDYEGNIVGASTIARDITERKRAQERAIRQARQAALRADVSAALGEGGDMQIILQRCTESMVHNLDAAFARIWTLDELENVLELRASAGMYTHLDGPHSRVPVGSLKIGLIARERLPHLTNDVLDDPRVSDKEWALREGMVAFAGYPLIVEDRLVGVVAMFAREELEDDVIEALASVADTIAQGIERKRAEEALRGVREAERNRIARDLHDDILQDIVYALQEIQIVQVTSEDGAAPGLEEAREALRRSVEGLRGAIFELRLRDTLGRSFVSSLEALMDLNRRRARKSCELELIVEDGFPRTLPEKVGQELVRIVQEALANVRRHAEARHVRVRLWCDGDLACVEVADDGRGFDTGNSETGVGQQSMRHRALEIGGVLEVESAPGRGTCVRFEAPVSRLAAGS